MPTTYKNGLRQVEAFRGNTAEIGKLITWANGNIFRDPVKNVLIIQNNFIDDIKIPMELVHTVYFIKMPAHSIGIESVTDFERDWTQV